MDGDKKVYLECDCSAKDHIVVVNLFKYGDDDDEIFLTINTQMIPYLGLWGRIKAAFRYIFKPYDMCNFGGWTDCLVKDEKIHELEALISEYNFEKAIASEEKIAKERKIEDFNF